MNDEVRMTEFESGFVLGISCFFRHSEIRHSSFPAAAAGFEPASVSLTESCPTIRRHRNISSAWKRRRESTQRESNPHFRHGEPTGFRYIMGANILTGLSKSRLDLREARGPSSAADRGESEISKVRFEMFCSLL